VGGGHGGSGVVIILRRTSATKHLATLLATSSYPLCILQAVQALPGPHPEDTACPVELSSKGLSPGNLGAVLYSAGSITRMC
jgi:hypothetical protein